MNFRVHRGKIFVLSPGGAGGDAEFASATVGGKKPGGIISDSMFFFFFHSSLAGDATTH